MMNTCSFYDLALIFKVTLELNSSNLRVYGGVTDMFSLKTRLVFSFIWYPKMYVVGTQRTISVRWFF